MDTDENKIIACLNKLTQLGERFRINEYIELIDEFNRVVRRPLGEASAEFIDNPNLERAILELQTDNQDEDDYSRYLPLWLYLEQYIKGNTDEKFRQVETALGVLMSSRTEGAKTKGMALLPREIANQIFVASLFGLNDERLSKLFLRFLPVPKIGLFNKDEVPKILLGGAEESKKVMERFIRRNQSLKKSFSDMEKDVIKIQRLWRAKKRAREDLARVAANFGLTEEETKQLLRDANTPYHPKCKPELSSRLVKAAKKVKLFSEVRHLTAASAITSIFNDALYGRRSLLGHAMNFTPAALSSADIVEGDASVVCLGAYDICPMATHGMELTFDVEKISEGNPCVFYKQRDLHSPKDRWRNIKIGDFNLIFDQTGKLENSYAPFKVSEQLGWSPEKIIKSSIKSSLLVAYDVKRMHQILTLNFFRFLDELDNKEYIERVYGELEKLDDKSLQVTLRQIGQQASDTMEFNFYGAYKIDFSALKTISQDDPKYTIEMENFIEQLNAGNKKLLEEARSKIPEVFKSRRFIDYLISVLGHEEIKQSLQELREQLSGHGFNTVDYSSGGHGGGFGERVGSRRSLSAVAGDRQAAKPADEAMREAKPIKLEAGRAAATTAEAASSVTGSTDEEPHGAKHGETTPTS